MLLLWTMNAANLNLVKLGKTLLTRLEDEQVEPSITHSLGKTALDFGLHVWKVLFYYKEEYARDFNS